MNILIIGGTSGLGLELARSFARENRNVIVTGRRDPKVASAKYQEFDLTKRELSTRIETFVKGLPTINVLVYAAGYFQEGRVTDLSDEQIEQMFDVGARGLVYFVKALLTKQGSLDQLITITSTSQWTPRQKEPIYNLVKAGAGHFSNAIAEDGRVGKVLVAGPAGMKTNFWAGVGRDDIEDMMDPKWVAEQIMELNAESFKYRFAKILRKTGDLPPRIEIVETR